MVRPSDLGVVVGVDGTPGAQVSVSWAAQRAHDRALPLTLVHVYPDVIRSSGPGLGALDEELRRSGVAALRGALAYDDQNPGAADFAFRLAAEISRRLLATQVCEHLITPFIQTEPGIETQSFWVTARKDELAKHMDVASAQWPTVGIECATLVGDLAHTLVRSAAFVSAIVVGRDRWSWLPAPRMGSVAHHLLHKAQAPVIVVPQVKSGGTSMVVRDHRVAS